MSGRSLQLCHVCWLENANLGAATGSPIKLDAAGAHTLQVGMIRLGYPIHNRSFVPRGRLWMECAPATYDM